MTEKPNLELVPEPEVSGDFPRTFGNYLLLVPLGQGGMGDVYLAKHGGIAGIEKHCVIKMLRPQFTDDREYVSRFIDEARVVVQLSHKNICHVFDVGNVEGRYYLAMEYIAGNDLKSLVSTGQVDLGLTLHIVNEVLEALDYAHRISDPTTGEALKLVHRDVSPQNVMISYEGEVKLIDFGLAASTLKLERTEPNVVMGKVAYMSPEQVRGDIVDGRTDIFAVGVMLYELLTMERYYEGKSPYEIWAHAGAGNFTPRKWNDLDPELRGVLAKALAPNRETRWSTCDEMRTALEEIRIRRALRGSSVQLRQIIEKAMPTEISDARARLARFKNVKLLRTASGSVASGSSGSSPSAPATGAVVRADPESTETLRKEFGSVVAPRSKRIAMFAGAAVAGAVLTILVVFAVKGIEAPATTAAPPNGALTNAAPTNATSTPTNATSTPTNATATPTNATATPTNATPTNATPTNATGATATASGNTVSTGGTPSSTGTAPSADAPPAPSPSDAAPPGDAAPASAKSKHTAPKSTAHDTSAKSAKADAPSSSGKPLGITEEVAMFARKCPKSECGAQLGKMAPEFTEHARSNSKADLEWLHMWKLMLDECRAQCK